MIWNVDRNNIHTIARDGEVARIRSSFPLFRDLHTVNIRFSLYCADR